MQPGSKGRLTTKASNFSKELDEDLLCQVFSFRNVAGHSQAEGVNPAIMPLVKQLESGHVALSCSLRQRVICFRLRLGFGCGHVFVFGLATKFSVTLVFDASRLRLFQRSDNLFLSLVRDLRGSGRPQRGCDAALRARRCLAQPKSIEFPLPQQRLSQSLPQVQ